MRANSSGRLWAALACVVCAVAAQAQFPQLITHFETNGAGVAYPFQPGSLGDLQVVMFQDPAEADVTFANIRADALAIQSNGTPPLPSTEESFVAAFVGFNGANGSSQFMDLRFQWTSTDPNRWALIETLQSPQLGDPSIHLGGKVRLYVNLPNCAQFEYPGLVTLTPEVGIALLVSETGRDVPLGFQDNDVLSGAFEFVGVSSVINAGTANPVPVPTRFIPVTDAMCAGQTTGPTGNWRLVEFDLPTEGVVGWTFKGGNGVLDATGVGDGVNRGVLAGIVLTVRNTDTTSDFVEFLVDQIEFEAPVIDPAPAPAIASPVIAGDTSVQVNEVVPRATNVTVEIDRSDANNNDPFVADETYNQAPNLSTTGELRYTVVNVPALGVGDRLRARQAVNAAVGPDSLIVTVNPPAVFSATLSLDEDGSLGTVAVFEYVGATSVIPPAGPQGKPVFTKNGVWQKLEYSLIPGIEPVISFAGGNGLLEPNGGLYNIDAMFFTIDSTAPSVGPYTMFIDHVYYIDVDGNEQLIADAEVSNPFASWRGQSTSISRTSTLSTLTSYDGISSNRHTWSFPDTAANNTNAPFRPAVTFPDSAKAVGMYLLVEDARTSTLPLPAVEQRIVGVAPAVLVSNYDPNTTAVRLIVNGEPRGTANPAGAATVNIAPTSPLALGDSVSAEYDLGGDTSDLAYPRGVAAPPAPAVQAPLVAGQTTVTVTGIMNNTNATASLVRVYAGATQIGSANPAGATSVVVTVSPALAVGQQISATQTVNTVTSVVSAPVGVGTGETYCVVINEFQYDDNGTDDREFVELYNADTVAVDISGWTVRCSDETAPPGDNNPDYVIPNGTVLAAGDYYVLGHAAVPNVDQVLPAGERFENDSEAVQILDQNGVVVDTLITEGNKGTPITVLPGEGVVWSNFQSIDGTPQSLARWLDGFDTGDNGRDFGVLLATPGASNNLPSLTPYAENFSGNIGDAVANWSASFVNLKVIDPTAATTPNTNAIPASPQGGRCGICWDPTGGGNECALIDQARFAINFSCQVYIDPQGGISANGVSTEGERWSIGIGMADPLYNFPTANGDTGLRWEFVAQENADTGTVGVLTFRLVDRNNGGNDGTVILDVPTAMITAGWHTITINRNYENVTGSFDALSASGSVPHLGPGVLEIGYRENVSGIPSTLRPPTIDAVTLTVPATPTLGACAIGCHCMQLTQATCVGLGGEYFGDGSTDCTSGPTVCLGDVNCDGAVTFADIDPFVARLGCPSSNPTACNTPADCTWLNADINEDGAVTFADIDPFVGTLGNVCP